VADETVTRLAEAAEAEFAARGIDGASVRRIAAGAGQRNTNAVGYHYGSKADLADAVYRLRQPMVDGRRGELLAELRPLGVEAAVTVVVRPFFDALAEPWGRNYLRFISRYGAWLRTSSTGDAQARRKRYDAAPNYAAAMGTLAELAGPEAADRFEQLLIAALDVIATERRPDPSLWIAMFTAGLPALERTH
jgi:AcrR family transcriptional regulator